MITQNQHVQYLVGPRYEWTFSPAVAIAADGHMTLIAPTTPAEEVAADEVLTYEAKSFSTLRNDQRQKSSRVLLDALAKRRPATRLGVEFSSFPSAPGRRHSSGAGRSRAGSCSSCGVARIPTKLRGFARPSPAPKPCTAALAKSSSRE